MDVSPEHLPQISELVSLSDACERLGMTNPTVRRHLKALGAVPVVSEPGPHGRSFFHESDIARVRNGQVDYQNERKNKRIVEGKPDHLRCNKCKGEKHVDEFDDDIRYQFGRTTTCRQCKKETGTLWIENNRDRRNQRRREDRKKHPEKARSRSRKEYLNHRESSLEYSAGWRRDNRVYSNAWSRAYKWSKQGIPSIRPAKDVTPEELRKVPANEARRFIFFLSLFADRKQCEGCRRLRLHGAFDKDGRCADGMSRKCFECLPAKKSAAGGTFSLSQTFSDGGKEVGEYIQNDSAPDPAAVVIGRELAEWCAGSLTTSAQDFLEAFMDADFDLPRAAKQCGITIETGQQLLDTIRQTARDNFGDD